MTTYHRQWWMDGDPFFCSDFFVPEIDKIRRVVRSVKRDYIPSSLSFYLPTNLHTFYIPIYLPSYLPIFLPIYLPTYLSNFPTYLPYYLPAYLPSYLSTFLPIYLPTYLPYNLSTFLPIYLPAYLPSYLPSYLSKRLNVKRQKERFLFLLFRVSIIDIEPTYLPVWPDGYIIC